MKFLQALHGYTKWRGHAPLVEPKELSSSEAYQAWILSDLSGYLPMELRFPPEGYLTGFPCGRYYALARTWLDESPGHRSGTVLTHTLLGAVDDVALLPDFGVLEKLHRRPASPADVEPYRGELELEVSEAPAATPCPAEALVAVQALLCTGPGKVAQAPVLWVDERQPIAVLRFLWGLLSVRERATFAFCTLALNTRSVGRRSFDFLALPPEARGNFSGVGGVWWNRGPALARQFEPSPWMRRLVEEGAAALEPLLGWCADGALPYPGTKDSAQLVRLIERWPNISQEGAEARLRALRLVWPDLGEHHPACRP